MRALVTGGAGFVGSHLARSLVEAGHEVQVLDDLSTGRAVNAPAGAQLVEGDVRRPDVVDGAVARADAVFHLAAAVGTRVVANDPAGVWERNVMGTAHVLEACARHDRPVLSTSSSEVYGPDGPVPLAEDDVSCLAIHGRREVYALSKAAGEAYAHALHRSRGLRVVIVRLFNVVGAGQSDRYGMVLPRFVAAARSAEPLPVYGDGRQRRCFLHVDEAVRALLLLSRSPAAVGRVVNVGSGDEVRILDLARLVLEEAGGGSIRHIPFDRIYGSGFVDPPRRVPSLARLESLTAFRPRRGIRDAVRDQLAVAASR